MSVVERTFQHIDARIGKREGVAYVEQWLLEIERLMEREETAEWTLEERRKIFQFGLIKGLAHSTQPNHQMTPDAIGLLMSYITEKWTAHQKHISIADLAVGTGNLLMTVMNQLSHKTIEAYGVDVDEWLIRVSATYSNWLEQSVHYYVQDSLRPLLMEPVDVIVSDVPVGYYPDDENGLNYMLMPAEGHAYAHHLFIEQTVRYLKEDGIAVLLVPHHLFSSEQSDALHPYFKKEATISALFQLPNSVFKHASQAKSILVLEKGKHQREVLLAQVPELSDELAMAHFFARVNESLKERTS